MDERGAGVGEGEGKVCKGEESSKHINKKGL